MFEKFNLLEFENCETRASSWLFTGTETPLRFIDGYYSPRAPIDVHGDPINGMHPCPAIGQRW